MADVDHSLLSTLIREKLGEGSAFHLTVSSNSMAPLLRRGHKISVEAVSPSRLRPGEIVVLDEGKGFLTHRYWGKSSEAKLVTRGDRALLFDPPWEPEKLLGRVAARQGQTPLSLRRGPGAWLATHLGSLAALEQRLFAGYGYCPLPSPSNPTYLGRKLRENERYLPARLLRRAIRAWASVVTSLCTLIVLAGRSTEKDKA